MADLIPEAVQEMQRLAAAARAEITLARTCFADFLEEVENEDEVVNAWETIDKFDQAIERAGKGLITENMIFAEGLILIEFFRSAEIILRYARIDSNDAMQSWVARKRIVGGTTNSDWCAIQIDQRLYEALGHTKAIVALAIKIGAKQVKA